MSAEQRKGVKEKIVVIGGGDHARVVISILKKLGWYEIIGYTDLEHKGDLLGVPYIGKDEELQKVPAGPAKKHAVLGLGQISTDGPRKKVAARLKDMGFKFPPIISPNAVINEGVSISEGTVIMDGVIISCNTEIGRFCILNTHASVDHDCNIGDFVHIAPGAVLAGGSKIGNGTLIGPGAVITLYRKIGENCVIGAGAVVTQDCTTSGSYYGIPAKIVS